MIGFSELAHRELGQPACGGEGGAAAGGGGKVLEYIQGIRSAGASLLVIINDILDFSKIESGGLDLRNERYRPSSLLNDVITLIRVRLSGKPVALATDISPDIPAALFGDAGRVRQILL
ncbi:MAG: hypothetical protein LBG06_09325, partial [Deltaproteobacteria bacterium]|nr:hypothetical protein [Deltaproteobacteria bacterium]